jgi:putative MATE family efflux protein
MREQDELVLSQNHDDVVVAGSTWAAIWHMTWPGLLNMITIAVASFADVWVAKELGPETQAAIGIGGQIWFFMTLLAVALSAGTTALVSRFWGARDFEGAAEAARQSLVFAFLFGFVSMAIGLVVARPLYHVLGASPRVEELGWQYLQYDLLSQVPFTTLWVAHSIFRAKGNPRVPLLNWLIMMVLIIVLDVALCLKPLHLGVAGIGIAWLAAAVLGLGLNIIQLGRSDIRTCVDFRPLLRNGLSTHWFKRLLNIGLPACIQDLSWVGGNFVLFGIFAQTPDPTSFQASWAVGLRLEEMIAGMPVYALAMAVGTIVGQNLGAKQPARAERAGWQCALIGASFNALIGLIMFTCALPIAQVMSSDATVLEYTKQYLQIVGASEPMVALWLILFGAMQGAGYTKWPMVATTICLVVLRLPLSWYLTVPLHLTPSGCWLGIASSSIVLGLVAVWRFKTGVWKLQKV